MTTHWIFACTKACLPVVVATAAFMAAPLQAAGPEDGPPPQDGSGAPPPAATSVSTPEPLYSIPAECKDPAFEKYVDLRLLGDAYFNNDPELIIDVALQLLEGERILLRSHHGLKAADLLDVALRLAAEQRHMDTLERLNQVAERQGDKALAEKVELSKQLAAQPRAVAPPVPPASEKLSPDDVAALQEQILRMERARAVGDLAALKKLQSELSEQETSAEELETYLEEQIAEAISDLSEETTEPDEIVRLLGDLSGASRGVTGFRLLKTSGGDVAAGALPFKLDLVNRKIYVSLPGGQVGGGFNEWVDQASFPGLDGRYGTTWVNFDWKPEVTSDFLTSDGKPARSGRWFQVQDWNPDFVKKAVWNGQDWNYSFVGMKDTFALQFEVGPVNASAIIAAATQYQPAARIVAAGGGNFTYKQIVAAGGGNLTFDAIVAAGGGNFWPGEKGVPPEIYARAGANPNGGATYANIVAAGGGNVTINHIVAAGGGNLRPIGRAVEVPKTSLPEMWGAVAYESLIQDGGAYLVGQDGASLLSKGTAGFTERLRNVFSTSQSPFFKSAQKR